MSGTFSFLCLVAARSKVHPRQSPLLCACRMHAYIWHFPKDFARRSAQWPFSLFGRTPVKVFAKLEMVGKIQQLSAIVAYWGTAPAADAVRSAIGGSGGTAAQFGLVFIVLGQLLNVATYAAIGDAGVY